MPILVFNFRNLNAVRSIAKVHGNPVDRHKIMAQVAVKKLFNETEGFFITRFARKCLFQFKLWFVYHAIFNP